MTSKEEEFYRNVECLSDSILDALWRDVPADWVKTHVDAVMDILLPAFIEAEKYASEVWSDAESVEVD
jgi:hypothetical protein